MSPLPVRRTRSQLKPVPQVWRVFDKFFGILKFPYLALATVINLVLVLDFVIRFGQVLVVCLTVMANFFPVIEKMVGLVLLSYCIVMLVRFIITKAREGKGAGIKVKKDV